MSEGWCIERRSTDRFSSDFSVILIGESNYDASGMQLVGVFIRERGISFVEECICDRLLSNYDVICGLDFIVVIDYL